MPSYDITFCAATKCPKDKAKKCFRWIWSLKNLNLTNLHVSVSDFSISNSGRKVKKCDRFLPKLSDE